MWTLNYKGFYLHGYCDRSTVRINCLGYGIGTKECQSLQAAKLYVTTKLIGG